MIARVQLTDRLPACDKRHPDVPPQVRSQRCFRDNGTPYMRSVCLVCKRARNADTQMRIRAGVRAMASASCHEPYGLVQLNWLDTAPGVPYAYVGGLEFSELTNAA